MMAARAGRRQSHQVPSQLDSLRVPMMASVHEVGLSLRCPATPNRAPTQTELHSHRERRCAHHDGELARGGDVINALVRLHGGNLAPNSHLCCAIAALERAHCLLIGFLQQVLLVLLLLLPASGSRKSLRCVFSRCMVSPKPPGSPCRSLSAVQSWTQPEPVQVRGYTSLSLACTSCCMSSRGPACRCL